MSEKLKTREIAIKKITRKLILNKIHSGTILQIRLFKFHRKKEVVT